MKKIPQHLQDTLLDYLDGNLSLSEQKSVETLLQHDAGLAARLDELRSMNSLMQKPGLEHPSKDFTSSVMGNLDRQPVVQQKLSLRNGILLLAGMLVTLGMAAMLLSNGVFDNSAVTLVDLNKINFPKEYIKGPLPSIPFNGKVFVNVIIVLNLILAFVVLDRAILKPYFRRRVSNNPSRG